MYHSVILLHIVENIAASNPHGNLVGQYPPGNMQLDLTDVDQLLWSISKRTFITRANVRVALVKEQ